jgi:nucleotide-binding universal stress UspA family protein
VSAGDNKEQGMNIESILVATDLSVEENVAVQRASQLARAHGADIKLAYLPLDGQNVPTLAGLARGVDLVVLRHRSRRSTAAFFRAQPVMRLLRECECPVLVTRDARDGAYLRTLVGIDLSARSEALVGYAADFAPEASLELFHAIGTREEAKLRSADATEHAISLYRRRVQADAAERMLTLTDSFDARRNRFLTTTGRGDPGMQLVVQQQRSGADLVVVGKSRSSAWGDFLCGSVAHRVLSWGSSDVLVVPHPFSQATAPIASDRLRAANPRAAFAMGSRGTGT